MSRKSFIFWFVVLPDIVLLYGSLWLAVLIRYGSFTPPSGWGSHLQAFTIIYILWLVVFFIHGLFDISSFRRYFRLLLNTGLAMGVNALVAITYFYIQPELILTPRRFLLINLACTFVLIISWHFVIRYFLKNRLTERLYLYSESEAPEALEHELASHDYLGFRVIGRVNEENLAALMKTDRVGVVLPENIQARPALLRQVYEMRKGGILFYNYAALYEDLFRKIYITRLSEAWFLENIQYREKKLYTLLKRTVDIVAGLIGSVVFAVSYPLFATLIKLTSPGPVLFVQERVGVLGNVFKVYKYRTMRVGIHDTWTRLNDDRITTVGAFLRKSRFDELPQCLNLVMGNMSLVGPRPEQPHLVEHLRSEILFYDERHVVKPGITGWAQINNAYAATVEESRFKLQYDLYYIKHRSLLFDIEVILKTIYYVLSLRGR